MISTTWTARRAGEKAKPAMLDVTAVKTEER